MQSGSMQEKLFYSISEASLLTGIEPYVLRYWESEFDILRPEKDEAGKRRYRKKDIEIVLRIKELLYEDGYTIAGAKKVLRQHMRGRKKEISYMLKKELQEILNILE